MLLDSLVITKNGQIVRQIPFSSGLNIITNRKNIGHSGNSVGKSTLSRVVDYLFLASIDPVYIDEEFKLPNTEIQSLFEEHHVMAQLNFTGVDNKLHQIERRLAINPDDELYYFDGVNVKKSTYESKIKELCFAITTPSPTVRSAITKFIRNNNHRMLNTTHFLDARKGKSGKDYSELYLYLFGFEDTEMLTEKRKAKNLLDRRGRNLRVINALIKEQKIKTEATELAKSITTVEQEILNFNFSPLQENPISKLSSIQQREDSLAKEILSVDRKVENINSTVKKLSEATLGGYLKLELEEIYSYANVAISGAIRDLEEASRFHAELIEKKKDFLARDMPELVSKRDKLAAVLNNVFSEKKEIFEGMKDKQYIDNITKKIKELGDLKVQLGRIEGLNRQQEKAIQDEASAQTEFDDISKLISQQLHKVYEFTEKFNEFFSENTQLLHNESYTVTFKYDDAKGNCSLELNNKITNPEGGKKKAEVIAFDFAYISAVASLGLPRPRFVFHDFVEDIDQRQFEDILGLAKLLPGQQILSVLADNLDPDVLKEMQSNIVLELDETDRFFKV